MESSLQNLKIDRGEDEKIISNMSHDEIMALVFNLPDGYRQVFSLYAIEGYSHKEIGDRLQIQESSSRSRYHRAKVMLQEEFNKVFKVMIA